MPQIKKPISVLLSQEQTNFLVKNKIMSAVESEAYGVILQKLEDSRIERDQPQRKFDDMTYHFDYVKNGDALNSYLMKKKNDGEVRVNTGTTEKKVEVVQNELLSLNLQPTIQAFDNQDNRLVELGSNFTDIVFRTGQQENDDDFWIEATQEVLSQRALYIEEGYREVTNFTGGLHDSVSSASTRIFRRAEKRVLCGLQMYLADYSIPAYLFDTQPFIMKYERMSLRQARTIYGRYENFKYVRGGGATPNYYNGCFDYRLNKSLTGQEVEVLHYMSASDNEYQIIVNGVMMLELGTKLPWNHPGYRIKMIVLKPMGRNFCYGKPLVASAKTLQALDNETIRLLIRKFRQAIEPPMAVKNGKLLAKGIFDPGKTHQGVKKEDFESLIDHKGVTESEFAMFKLIEQKIEEFVGMPNIMQGLPGKGSMTATEVMHIRKQAMKMLGLSVYAISKAKREATYLRIYTVMEFYTKPLHKRVDAITDSVYDVYRKFTVESGKFENGQQGRKVIQFMDRDLTENENELVYTEEQRMKDEGKPIRYVPINIKKLNLIPTLWFVTVNPKDREGSELHKAMFNDNITQVERIAELTGRQVNDDTLIQDYERTWQVKDMFKKAPPQQIAPPGQGQLMPDGSPMPVPGSGQGVGQKMRDGVKPTLNNVVKAS